MKNLRIHTFMHVPFEGLGCINQWITDNSHTVTYTKFYENNILPEITDIDWLIVMGGPMGVYDDSQYTWLADEKAFIKKAIESGKVVLGICLGSQLIAEVLGAKVFPNTQKEIGWFNLSQTQEGRNHPLLKGLEKEFTVFHWHGDTFDLPTGSVRLFQSEITVNQGFLYSEKVLGLQFHFEVTADSLKDMVSNGLNELVENQFIHSASEILAQSLYIDSNNMNMFKILNYLSEISE